MLKNFYDVDTYGPHIPDSSVKEIFNSIVRIKKDSGTATGFFLKIKVRDRELNSLITNCHVISQEDVLFKKKIYIYYGNKENEITKVITLNSCERFIRCFDYPKDITVIELKNYDYIPDYKFLLPDLEYKNGYYNYNNQKFYLAGYPGVNNYHNGERHISSGRVFDIYLNNIEFEHTLDTRNGSSGAPICLLRNGKVIGVHKAHKKQSPLGNLSINKATFIGVIIDELEKEYYLLPEIRNPYDYKSSFEGFNNFGLDQQTLNFLDFNNDFFKFDNSEKIFNEVNEKISDIMNKSFSLFEKNDFFKEDDFFSTKRNNNFLKKEKKLKTNRNRNKTPICYNHSYYGLKECLTENYSNYNYTTQNNFYNKDKDYNSNKNSLIRQSNKSYEPKLKNKKRNKKKKERKNIFNEINKIMNNITTYTAKHNKEAFEYSPYDQSLNYYKINKETKFARSRNNNNYCSYVSKSYDNVRKSISKRGKNIYMNISTINNKIESYQYDNSKSDFSYNYCNMFSLNCNYI